jgi:cell division protein FtsB
VAKRSKRKARTRRTTLLLRWSVVVTVLFVAFLYYRPLSSYVQTRGSLNQRVAEVRVLRAEKTRLEARLADSATVVALAREARRMRLVRPGERLYIVRGVKEWRRAQAATLPGDG